MWIKELHMKNFHGFSERIINFDQQFTALVGNNGTGKTGVLDGLAIALGAFLSGIDGMSSRHIRTDEVYRKTFNHGGLTDIQKQFPVEVNCDGMIDGELIQWSRSKNSEKGSTTSREARELMDYATNLHTEIRDGNQTVLPVISYYGTGRLWVSRRDRSGGKLKIDRIEGYRHCLVPDSDEKNFRLWIRKMTYTKLQRGEAPGVLTAVEEAIYTCMKDWKEIYYDVDAEEVRLKQDDGRILPFHLLSDGIRNMIGLISDIAHRMALLNPFLENDVTKETPGVILIDEIDLHLHPEWQRRIVDDLKRVFPKVQFIVTTHSPFIIQSLEEGQLRRLHHEDDDESVDNNEFVGRSIEDITEQVMEVDEVQRSRKLQKMFKRAEEYYTLLEKATSTESSKLENLKSELDEIEAEYSDQVAYYAFLKMERKARDIDKEHE